MNHQDCLRLLALNDAALIDECTKNAVHVAPALSDRDVALVRLGAMVAIGAATASYGELVDAALDAGITEAEIVDVLLRAVQIVGVPRIVAETPKLALAIGYDVEAAVEEHFEPSRD
jgi:alkylhydroperoxidase/carboxymuconolactone decarboxylase family protein YurZ